MNSTWKWKKGMDGRPPRYTIINGRWELVKYKFNTGIFKNKVVVEAGSDHGFMHFNDAFTNAYLGWCGVDYFKDNTTRKQHKK